MSGNKATAMSSSKIQCNGCGQCICHQQTNQTSHMMSILSSSQVYRNNNNSMTLIKGNRAGGLSSLGHNTTIYGEESLVENGEIEEMHYLMVKVERMKKQMLGKVEGIRIKAQSALEKRSEIDMKEDMLYENDEVI